LRLALLIGAVSCDAKELVQLVLRGWEEFPDDPTIREAAEECGSVAEEEAEGS